MSPRMATRHARMRAPRRNPPREIRTSPVSSPTEERQLKDPYRLDPKDVATPPRRLGHVLRYLGPGLITAAAIVGSGELIATTVLGAENGYLLLWLILVSCPVKIFVLHEIGRYTIATGETSLEAFNRVPGPRFRVSWVVWLYGLLILCSLFPQGGMMGAISEILHTTFPAIPLTGWLWAVAVLTFFLLAKGSYGPVEKIALGLVVAFTILTVGCAIVLLKSPEYFSWSRVLEGLSFSLPQGSGFGTAVTVFGITGAGSMDLIQYPYWCIEKGYARFTGPREATEVWTNRAFGWIRVMSADVFVSLIFYTFPTIAFYLLGAGILPAVGVVPKGTEMVGMLSSMFTEILGGWSFYLFMLGAFAVLYSTVFAGSGAMARGTADLLANMGMFDKRDYRGRLRAIRILIGFFLFVPALLFMFVREPVLMVKIGGIAQASMLPIIAMSTIYLRYRHVPKAVLPKGWITLMLWVTTAIIVVMMSYSLIIRHLL